MKISSMARSILSRFQSRDTSMKIHGNSYKRELMGHSTVELQMHQDLEESFKSLGPEFRGVIENAAKSCRVAVDIGAGTGWLSKFLSNYFTTVLSVEPSSDGVVLGKKLLTQKDIALTNGIYFNLKGEDFFSKCTFLHPTFVIFQTVLSHLPNEQVTEVLNLSNTSLPCGSVILFSEVYGDEHSEVMWFVRNQLWWKSRMPEWNLEFFPFSPDGRKEFKGFSAIKVR
jgi:hypothetical protein